MFKNNKLASYFNLENFRLKNDYNIIYNDKMCFYVQKHNGWLLNKETTRHLLVQNMVSFLQEMKTKNNAMTGDIALHSYKIKNNNKKTNSNYYQFFEFIVEILKHLNPELYKKLSERNYIEKLRQEIRWIYNKMEEVDYFTAISYGSLYEDYALIKDKYHIGELMNTINGDLFYELLSRFNNSLNSITDGLETIFGVSNYKELSNLQFLYNFFSENISYMDNNTDVINLLDTISEDNDLIVEFNNYISEYEKYSSQNKWKYKNKIIYQLFLLYQKTKEKYFSNYENYESLIPIKVKEVDVYSVNDYFYKTLYVVPVSKFHSSAELELDINKIESTLNKIDINFGYILNQTIKPFTEGDYNGLFLQEGITDEKMKQDLINIGLFHTTYTITIKSIDYSVFSNIEGKLKELEISSNLKLIEDKNISNLFPYYRNGNYSFITSTTNLFPSDYVENGYQDVFFNFFPKKINYEKGAIIGTNKETLTPVFFNATDEKICANKHMVVIGKAGSGKTYGTKILTKNALMYNKFILVDHMGNYNDINDNFIEKHGGKVISLGADTLVNPLIYNNKMASNIETHLDYIMAVFSGANGEDKSLSTHEERLLRLILSNIYKRPYRKTKDGTTYVNLDELIQRTEEFLEVYKAGNEADNSMTASSLIQFFKSIKTGLLGKYLMSDNQLDITETLNKENLVLFDFKELKNTGSNVVITIFSYLVFQSITKYIYDSFEDRINSMNKIFENSAVSKEWYKKNINPQVAVPIYLVIDEIHYYLNNSDVIKNLLKLIVKEARNKTTGLISITQEVKDFLENDAGKSIFTQSSSYLLYNNDLPEPDFELIKKNLLNRDDPLGLDDSDIDFLKSGIGAGAGSALYIHGKLPAQKIQILSDPDFSR